MPESFPSARKESIRNFVAKTLLACFRLTLVLLRRLGVRRSRSFHSLLEFLAAHPAVQVQRVGKSSIELDELLEAAGRGVSGYVREDLRKCFVSCIFPYKIPVSADPETVMINVHPGLLPENRGPNPYFWALAKGHEQAGLTAHLLTADFDKGAVLARSSFHIPHGCSEHELEKLTTQHLDDVLEELFADLETAVASAAPQDGGSYYKEPDIEMRSKYDLPTIFARRE